MTDSDHGPHLPKPAPLDEPPAVPGSIPPVVPTDSPPPVDLATDDVPCRNCGFNLRGLSEDGRCPECGAPIWNSVQEDLLVYSSKSYLTSLYRGVCCILIAALLNIALVIVSIVVGIAITVSIARGGNTGGGGAMFTTTGTQSHFNAIIQTMSLPIALLSLYGWWLLSAPDPGQRIGDKGQTPRQVVRIAVTILASTNVFSTTLQFVILANPSLGLIAGGMGIISAIAGIVLFFAAMLYLQWLGPRIPSETITNRARLYMWLLPVIFVIGNCLIVGPLVAWIMYLLLLNQVRVALKRIRHEKDQEEGPVNPPESAPAFGS